MHGIKTNAKIRTGKQLGDFLEIEQRLLQLGVVRYRIDNLNDHIAQFRLTLYAKIDVGRLDVTVAIDRLGTLVKGFGKRLVGRTAIGHVVLDAEVAVGSAGVMAGRQDDAAKSYMLTDYGTRRRCGQNPILTDHDTTESSRRRHAQDDLDGDVVEIASVAAEHQGLAFLPRQTIENRLHEVLQVTRLGKYLDLLAQPRSPRLLPGERFGGYGNDLHLSPLKIMFMNPLKNTAYNRTIRNLRDKTRVTPEWMNRMMTPATDRQMPEVSGWPRPCQVQPPTGRTS